MKKATYLIAACAFAFSLPANATYYDAETGTFYNYFRDYDPSIGRYVESDPIGLDGGFFSTYSYVGANPTGLRDLFGLNPGDYFAGPNDAAIDMYNYIRTHSKQGGLYSPRNEVGGYIISSGNCFTYLAPKEGSKWGAKGGDLPSGYIAAFHTHTLVPNDPDSRRGDFSRPGDVPEDPLAGDLSDKNRAYYGVQYVGSMEITGYGPERPDGTRPILVRPVIRMNTGKDMKSTKINATEQPCVCQK